MSDAPIDWQARAEGLLGELLAGLDEEQALYAAAVLANRTANELHRRARAGANDHRGGQAWGVWAGLQNAARNLVLQSSTCRDAAARLAGRAR
jgi:hypothetical protein